MLSLGFRPNIGGLETHLDDLCEYLTQNNHFVNVITYQPITTKARDLPLEEGENLRIRRIRWFGHRLFFKLQDHPAVEFFYLFPGIFIYSFFFLLRNRHKIDVVHAQGLVCGVIGAILARLFGKRAVASTHSIYRPKSFLIKWVLRKTFSSFDAVLCLSEQSRKELEELGVERSKLGVFTYWVDQNLFKPEPADHLRADWGWQGKFVALFVGRLLAEKGVELLLAVALASENRHIYFVFAGDGPLSQKVREVSKRQENVIFLGPLASKDLVPYYNAADVLVVPSLSEEGFGRVILEALSCGTPVIVSNRGGIPEAVSDSVGVLVEPEVKALSNALVEVNRDADRLAKLKENCRAYAVKRFSQGNAQVIERSYYGDGRGDV